MVDYSKWDKIELSDDSDDARHPIHSKTALKHTNQKRAHNVRREVSSQIEALEAERTTNDELLRRLRALKGVLEERPPNAETRRDMLSQALAQTAPASREQDTPPRPYAAGSPISTYSEMMKLVVASIDQALEKKDIKELDFVPAALDEVEAHCQSINRRQEAIAAQLKDLEPNSITSDSYQVTSDGSNISKSRAEATTPAENSELLRQDPQGRDRISDAVLQFAQMEPTNYQASQTFIASHRDILQDGAAHDILGTAKSLSDAGQHMLAWRHVHQALTLHWCRSLGEDGVAIFFQRITTRPEARESFLKEVAAKFQQMQATSTQ
ncbi:hypothetical protein NLG97_g9477 [Lecanicillium saksenae]|uniref:Uncharacterized protein n=1 Tax=Lecanicillium saksenae TaxID=468837 RepID=A0ACC1QGF6_9HYPO|nr:hypothetical protein NLG97_g9477 [Lecanicillium saksenae]